MSAATSAGPGPASSTGSSHPFTCNTCQVAFRSSDLQRTHMQSDWHRYNLKRRVASLPPLTSEIFAEKVLANKASAAATAARASFEKVCPACTKTYYSENAYQNHLGSSKHRAQVAQMQFRHGHHDSADTESMMSSTFSLGDPVDTASTISAAENGGLADITNGMADATVREDEQTADQDMSIRSQTTPTESVRAPSDAPASVSSTAPQLNQCLFCNISSEDVDVNVRHMTKQHGMFIPERDYLVNLEGLLGHLHETIFDLHECLYCHQMKHTASGVQTHMRDRGHCMIAYSTEEEMLDIGDFYDFSSTYSDAEESDVDEDERPARAAIRLGAARATKVTVENDGDEEALVDDDEEGWESDASSLSSVPTDEITAMPIDDHSHRYKTLDKHRHHSHNDPRPHREADGFHSHAHTTPRAVYHDEYELHLPSGRTAGHRSLHKYYKQNLSNRPTPEERISRRMIEAGGSSDEEMEDSQPSNERDRGRQIVARQNRELGMVGVSDAKKQEVRAVEKKARKLKERAQKRYEWGNNKRSNMQKHYRDPLLQ